MYQHLLIATDGSGLGRKAVDQGIALAKALGARVLAVHVTEGWTDVPVGDIALSLPPENYEREVADNAQSILADVALAAKTAGVPCETLHVPDREPAQGIIEAAHDRGVDLIVMASHGRSGFARLVLGSEANEVVSKSTVPVLICR
jgi:nucleotide-binding universal stress UspA family protein